MSPDPWDSVAPEELPEWWQQPLTDEQLDAMAAEYQRDAIAEAQLEAEWPERTR
jgi:hypothetical protein